MRSRFLAVLGALAFTLAGLAGGQLVSAGPAMAEPAHCVGYIAHPDLYSSGGIGFAGTAIRDDPWGDCDLRTTAHGGDGINVYCARPNADGNLWLYVKDLTKGVAGWARWDDLWYASLFTSVWDCSNDGSYWVIPNPQA